MSTEYVTPTNQASSQACAAQTRSHMLPRPVSREVLKAAGRKLQLGEVDVEAAIHSCLLPGNKILPVVASISKHQPYDLKYLNAPVQQTCSCFVVCHHCEIVLQECHTESRAKTGTVHTWVSWNLSCPNSPSLSGHDVTKKSLNLVSLDSLYR